MTTATENGIENPLRRLTPEQLEELAREFDALHDEVKADLGERDAAYIHGIIDLHRRLGLIGRALLIGSRFRPLWVAGTATLSLAKILENMEIGHNVLHGQWDWMNHPVINSTAPPKPPPSLILRDALALTLVRAPCQLKLPPPLADQRLSENGVAVTETVGGVTTVVMISVFSDKYSGPAKNATCILGVR